MLIRLIWLFVFLFAHLTLRVLLLILGLYLLDFTFQIFDHLVLVLAPHRETQNLLLELKHGSPHDLVVVLDSVLRHLLCHVRCFTKNSSYFRFPNAVSIDVADALVGKFNSHIEEVLVATNDRPRTQLDVKVLVVVRSRGEADAVLTRRARN